MGVSTLHAETGRDGRGELLAAGGERCRRRPPVDAIAVYVHDTYGVPADLDVVRRQRAAIRSSPR